MVIIDAQIHVWSPDVSTRPLAAREHSARSGLRLQR